MSWWKKKKTVLIQTVQFSVSIEFIYMLLNDKTVLFQTIQFSISFQFTIKTVLFQAVWFSLSTHFSPFLPIDSILVGATSPGQSGSGSICNERIFPKAPALLERHHLIV